MRNKRNKCRDGPLVFCPFPGNETSPESFLLHNALARKPKRIRTAFSPSQLLRLEHAFEKNHYVVGAERKQLAHSLSLTETQVRDTTVVLFAFYFTCAFILFCLFCFLVYNAVRKCLRVSIDRFNLYSKETFLTLMLVSWNICDISI